MMKKLFGTLIFSQLTLGQLLAQGTMDKTNGHFTARLDFFGNYPLTATKGHIKGSALDDDNGLTNTDRQWYVEKGVKVKGLLKAALLLADWWPLFGEPTEQYQFIWQSSGHYDIEYTTSQGKTVSERISKESLTRYPDLLKRFNNLAPTEMAFEIKWKMGKPADTDIKKMAEKYALDANFYSGLGVNYLNANRLYKTEVNNGSLLFEPSGITPFATPGIRPGKGQEFLGIAAGGYAEADVKRILYWWQLCQTHTIDGFKAVKQNWPIDEMKAIAEKYLAYENGTEEPTPKEQIAQAAEKNKNIQAYSKDDFWGDAVEEENRKLEIFNENGKIGLKDHKNKIIVNANWRSIDIIENNPNAPILAKSYAAPVYYKLFDKRGIEIEFPYHLGNIVGYYNGNEIMLGKTNNENKYEKITVYSLSQKKVIFEYVKTQDNLGMPSCYDRKSSQASKKILEKYDWYFHLYDYAHYGKGAVAKNYGVVNGEVILESDHSYRK